MPSSDDESAHLWAWLLEDEQDDPEGASELPRVRAMLPVVDMSTFGYGERAIKGLTPSDAGLAALLASVTVGDDKHAGKKPTQPAAEAEADDEYAGITRGLSDNARSVIFFLHENTAYDRASKYARDDIACELGLSSNQLRVVFRKLAKQSPALFESKEGRGGGIWLTPAGKAVGERIPPQTCRQFKPVPKANWH